MRRGTGIVMYALSLSGFYERSTQQGRWLCSREMRCASARSVKKRRCSVLLETLHRRRGGNFASASELFECGVQLDPVNDSVAGTADGMHVEQLYGVCHCVASGRQRGVIVGMNPDTEAL